MGCSHIALQAPDLKKGLHTEARYRFLQPLQNQALHSCLVLLEQGHVDQPVLLCVLRIWHLTAVVYGLGWHQGARACAPQLATSRPWSSETRAYHLKFMAVLVAESALHLLKGWVYQEICMRHASTSS